MKVDLDLNETGYLCNLIMMRILNPGGTMHVPAWLVDLYTKLAAANDDLMMGKGASK